MTPIIEHRLRTACAPGCGVLITTPPDVAQAIQAAGHLVVPLRAVAHLRKAGFVIENLDPYLDGSLSVLAQGGGDPAHKRTIADALEIDVDKCKGADICKRRKAVYRTFVAHDNDGHYWLKPEFVNDQRR